MEKQTRIRIAALTAMFASLIIVTTAYIKIPAPLGYTHVGDSMIYLSAAILPGPFGFFAAAIGGAMADLLAGRINRETGEVMTGRMQDAFLHLSGGKCLPPPEKP